MTTDLRFLDIPVRLDSTIPRYAIDLENAKGRRIRIDLRVVDEPEADPAVATPCDEGKADPSRMGSSSVSLSERETLQAIDKRATGLYRKFENITRTDGSSAPGGKHDGCDYFVLDLTHDPHAPDAIIAYAKSCEGSYPLLAADLRAKVGVTSSARLQSERETLIAERDEAREQFDRHVAWADEQAQRLEAEIARLSSRLAGLRTGIVALETQWLKRVHDTAFANVPISLFCADLAALAASQERDTTTE